MNALQRATPDLVREHDDETGSNIDSYSKARVDSMSRNEEAKHVDPSKHNELTKKVLKSLIFI